MFKNWRSYLKAIVAFVGSLATSALAVAATKHGEAFTTWDLITILAMAIGVGGTTAGVYHAENKTQAVEKTGSVRESEDAS